MTRKFDLPPSLEEMETIARATLARLPEPLARHLTGVVVMVEDLAEDELLAEFGMESPFQLTGVYEGVSLAEQSIEHSGTMPPRIRLFRLPILLEWCERGDESLEHLVAHVAIHEIGHHFGLSDEDMHALEQQVV